MFCLGWAGGSFFIVSVTVFSTTTTGAGAITISAGIAGFIAFPDEATTSFTANCFDEIGVHTQEMEESSFTISIGIFF